MEKYFLLGRDGKIIGTIEEHSRHLVEGPILEIDTQELLKGPLYEKFFTERPTEDAIYKIAQKAYHDWGKFSPYGELIVTSVLNLSHGEVLFSVDFIARKAFSKGVLAADILPIFTDNEGKKFFVGIILSGKKHKGQPALIGGHLDLNGFHFETPIEALIHEAEDEAGIFFEPIDIFKRAVSQKPFLKEAIVDVTFSVRIYRSKLELLDIYRTGEEELMESYGHKRVDWTTAYSLGVNVDFLLTKEIIQQNLKPGIEAERLLILELGVDEVPNFAHSHHAKIFADALKKYC